MTETYQSNQLGILYKLLVKGLHLLAHGHSFVIGDLFTIPPVFGDEVTNSPTTLK